MQQAIAQSSIDPDLCRPMVLLGHHELIQHLASNWGNNRETEHCKFKKALRFSMTNSSAAGIYAMIAGLCNCSVRLISGNLAISKPATAVRTLEKQYLL